MYPRRPLVEHTIHRTAPFPLLSFNLKAVEKKKLKKNLKMIRRIILWAILFVGFCRIEAKAQKSSASIYDHLKAHGLPIGILPKGITEYSVDPTSGFFQINLTAPCDAKFENQFHYDFNISGYLSMGKIGELSGVSQQELFLWFPVKCIRVDDPSSGLIYFDVGVVDKQFSLSLFENPRDCTAADPDDHSWNGLQVALFFIDLLCLVMKLCLCGNVMMWIRLI